MGINLKKYNDANENNYDQRDFLSARRRLAEQFSLSEKQVLKLHLDNSEMCAAKQSPRKK